MIQINSHPTYPNVFFQVNGLSYPKKNYEIYYLNTEKDLGGNINYDVLQIGIKNKFNTQTLIEAKPFSSYTNDGVTPIASLDELLNLLSLTMGFNAAAGGSAAINAQVAENYSSFTAGDAVGDLAFARSAEGTKWLPYNLGGAYYGKGWYVWDGSNWQPSRDLIQQELHNFISINIPNVTVSDTAPSSPDIGDFWVDTN